MKNMDIEGWSHTDHQPTNQKLHLRSCLPENVSVDVFSAAQVLQNDLRNIIGILQAAVHL